LESSSYAESCGEPHERREEAHDDRLDQHRPEDLAARGPHRAQKTKFSRALRHDDREGVEDDEGTNEERDEAEDEQRRVEERERLLQALRLLVGDGCARFSLSAVREHCRNAIAKLTGRHAVLGRDLDRVERAHLVEQLLRGLELEDRERRAGEVVGIAESDDPNDFEGSLGPLEQNVDAVTDREVIALCRSRVDHDLVGRGGNAPVAKSHGRVLVYCALVVG
jgi:hypothetical protein